MKKKQIFLFIVSVLFYHTALAQNSIVNVSPLTGAANVVIPIYNFTRGQVSFPISLVNSGNGVKIKDVEGTAGIGWNVQAGGQVSRLLRGLPDDCLQDLAGNTRLGWMSTSNTAPAYISSFQDNGGNCTNETADLASINSNFPVTMDSEPDIFYVSAPGLSCQLVYDRNLSAPGFRPISYQDLRISYTTNSSGITSFTIINDKGIQYVFAAPEQGAIFTAINTGGTAPSYFTTKYQQYQHGISYYDNWHLTSVTDANGNGIVLTYTTATTSRGSKDPVSLYIAGATLPTFQYNVIQSITPKTLHQVQSTDGDLQTTQLTFNWTSSALSAGGTDQTYIDSISGMGKHFKFLYSPVQYVTSGGISYYRQFLRSFIDGSTNSPVNYVFSYYGETKLSPSSPYYSTTLPDSSSTQQDYWGYYAAGSNASILPKVWVNPSNPSYQRYQIYQSSTGGTNYTYSLTGNNMTVDTANVRTGALKTITNAGGGTTTIAYESNDFLDPQTGVVNPGNGIRVKTIKDDARWNSTAIYRNYSYLNPSSGVSSGKPATLPAFAFTIPYGGSATGSALWTAATALSTTDLSNEDHTVLYEYCRQSQTNGGVTLYQHFVPATNWDASAQPDCSGCNTADWAPTVNMIARHNCASAYGPIKNDNYSYPFIPNTNYDFERGAVKKVTNYLDDGATEVSETNYTYQRSFTPTSIYAFRFDTNPSGSLITTGYNKYKVYYSTSELTTTVVKSVFNSGAYNQQQNFTTAYTYGSANHKLVTQQDLYNSDGSTITTKISYTKDYPSAGAGTNPNVNAIYNLNQLNVNVPVESYQLENRAGITKITSGSLTLFNASTVVAGSFIYLPSQQLQLILPDGLLSTSFVPYTATGSGSSQSSTYNSNYFVTANYTNYDYSGYLITADDNNHHVITNAIDHVTYKPAITVKNAAYNEVAFNGFNGITTSVPSFNVAGSGSLVTSGGHTGGYYAFGTAQTATATVTKNTIAQNYIFSIWINAPAGTNTLNIALNGATAVPYTYTGTGSWKYYEWKIPVSAMPSSFTMAVTSAQAISIDDLIFYPETAEVATFTYDATTYAKNSQTDTNGISTYYKNDAWGRLLYVYDQDHNIVQRNTIVIPGPF